MNAKRILIMAGIIFGLVLPISARADVTLTVTPLTWNIIGLDSNSPASGPYRFPVGARVCNTGSSGAANVTSIFSWDSVNANIYLRSGSLTSITIGALGAGSCYDAYFEAEINATSAAYDTARLYHITATDSVSGATVTSPQQRELYVEKMVSRGRNGITSIKLNGTAVPAGGSMSLLVGNTYTIELDSFTATNGYNQLEAFINFPNTIFQITSVSTTFTADSSPYIASPINKLYLDACQWENDPNSPSYLSCVGGDGKAGGTLAVIYTVKIIGGGGTSETLNSIINDFSGSSYHYNSDYSAGARIANIIDPSNVSISKSFSPDSTSANGISALNITLTNPTPGAISGYNFTDDFPANMTVANPPVATTSGCGTPTFAPVAGAGSISFSNGTLAANSNCIISVNVTVSAISTYTNTTHDLFVGALDTGNSATANLSVTNPAPGTGLCNLTMAQWTFAGYTTNPPAANTKAADVTTATVSSGNGLTYLADTAASGGNPQPGLLTYGWPKFGPINTATYAYLQFAIDTSKYTLVKMQFDAHRKSNGPNNDAVYYSTDGTTWTIKSNYSSTTSWATYGPYDFTGNTSTTGVTYFRIYGHGANATSKGNGMNIDNLLFTGCGAPIQPTIAKSFSPSSIAVNAISTLTFTLTNTNTVQLTGAKFTDVLPAGLQVAAAPAASTTCTGSPTWAPSAGDTTLNFGQTTGADIPASGSCTISVNIIATTSGPHDNTSGYLYTAEGGVNTNSIASATLTAVLPPSISKQFAPDPILINGVSTLTFTITNPNQNDSLGGVAFSDAFPTSPGNMVVANPTNAATSGCGTPTFAPSSGAGPISFSNGTIAGGGTCTVTVDVTATANGTYNNTSGNVSHIINSATVNGNTASASLTVNPPAPAIAILKQVSTSSTGPWSSFLAVSSGSDVYYKFTIENIGNVPLNPVSVSDPTLAGTSVDPATCGWTNPLPVGSQTQDPTETCVMGPVTAVSGSHLNTATSHGTYGGTVYNSTPDSATYATTGLTIAKSATETYFLAAGDILHYSYLVTNSGYASLAGPVTVADDKSNNETCPAVSTVGDLDNYLDPGESITCTATYTVTAGDVTAGFVTNTASATVDGATSNTDSKTVLLDAVVVGDGTSPADKDVNRTVVDIAVSAFTLTMNDGPPGTVTGLVITGTNTTDVAANGVKIWIDNNGNSEWDSGDTQVGSGVSFSGSTATFTGLSLTVTSATEDNYIITYDISASATINDTLTAVVTGVTASTPVTNNDTTDAILTILGDAPTAVKLIFFEAVDYDDGILLQWRTGHEVRNLGFNIYREAGGQRERVNSQIIAGSALIAGSNIAVSAGRPYTWLDDSATGTYSYYLEDIDLSGKRTMYGPVTPVASYSQTPLIEQSTTLSGLSGVHTANRDATLKLKPRLSKASAIKPASVTLNAVLTPEQVQWRLAGAPAVKIFVQDKGWHRITQPELIAYGLGSVDPRYLQLYVNGKQTPIVVSGEKDGHFDTQDYIEFYGMGLDTPSTDSQTYWLVAATSTGLRVKTVSGGTRALEPSSFAFAVEARPRELYAPALPKNTKGDRFYGPIVFSEPAVLTLNVQHADTAAASKAQLDVTLQGIFDGAHQVAVILNDTKIGQVVFSNMDRGHASLQFDQQGLLREGDNTLQFIAIGGDMDFSLLDVVSLTYQHTYTADNDALRFTAYGGGKINVSGFSSSGIRVMDITNPNSVSNVSRTVSQQGSSYAATFNMPSTGLRTLLAFNDSSILHPAAITSNNPSAWHSANNGADMVIIAHSSLMSALNPLKQFREGQGHTVAIIDVEDIYDEFSFGNKTPNAIQDFLLSAYANWSGRPGFLLLTGDATVDPRDYLGYGLSDLVPTNLVDGTYAEAASDDLFTDFNSDGLPEMAVGRIPAATSSEVQAVVSKIIGYEQSVSDTWTKKVVVVSDITTGDDFDFDGGSDVVAEDMLSADLEVRKVYRGDYTSDELATQDLLESINQGALIVNYMGHGSEDTWNGNIFVASDAGSLTNGLKLPFFINMTCWNGAFPNMYNITISEALLKAGNGGAVAVWASSGLTAPDPQHVMNKEMVNLLFNGSKPTLGEAAAQAKAATSDMDVRRTWILFGDPMTRLKW